MADTPLAAALKFRRAADQLEKRTRQAERAAGLYVREVVLAASPKRVRNAGKKGGALGVAVKQNIGRGTLVAGTGPWHLVDLPTRPHLIGIGRRKETFGKAIGSSRRGFLRFGDGEVRAGPIAHPGTRGQRFFGRGVDEARPAVPRIIDAGVKSALYETFGL